MVLAKKQLSKVVAIVLVAMCAVAFMPLLNGEAFAAAKAKKPAKVTVQSAKQVTNTMKVKVTWKKAKNAKTYNVKIDKKVVKKGVKKLTYTSGALAAGTHKVYVQAVNGKKKGAWSKVKKVAVVDKAAAAVTISGEAVVGQTLTAVVTNKAGKELTSGVTYQWYRVNNFTGVVAEIAGATEATYVVTSADYWSGMGEGYQIYVKATAWGKTATSKKTDIVDAGYYAQLNDMNNEAVTAPFAGQTVYANIYNAVYGTVIQASGAKYQWYVDGVALKGKTANRFAITNDEIGKTLECKITWNGKEYTTGVSAPVIESKMPTKVEIMGASATNAAGNPVPAVGDTLNAAFTAPEAAADPDATYQWYVGSLELKGETKASYAVQKRDVGSTVKVKVTLSNGTTVLEDVTAPVVANQLSSKDFTAVIVGPDGKDWTDLAIDATANQIVKPKVYANGDTTKADVIATVGAENVEWYIDSVATANQLWYRDGEVAAPCTDMNLRLSAAYGTTTDGKAATFKALEKGLVGHTLIVVVPGNNTTYAGSVASSAVGPFGAKIGTLNITRNGVVYQQGRANIIAGVTTLNAGFAEKDTTATYQWYKSTDNGANYAAISGATGASYIPTSQDAYDGVNRYKVVATGTGSYMGTAEDNSSARFANSTTKVNVTIRILDEQGAAVAAVRPGAILTAEGNIDTAEATMTYEWTFTDVSAGTTTAPVTGKTFTVPADAEAGDTVAVEAENSSTNYNINQAAPLTVNVDAIKSVKLTSVDAAGKKADPANPVVGDVFTAAVDPANEDYYDLAWYYKDEYDADPATATLLGTESTYNVMPGDLGKTLVAVATGKGSYAGTSAKKETGEVKVEVELVAFVGDQVIDNDTQLYVGNTITVEAFAGEMRYTESVTNWAWTTSGSEPAEGNAYTIQNNDINGGNISVEAAGPFTNEPTWEYPGNIQPKQEQ